MLNQPWRQKPLAHDEGFKMMADTNNIRSKHLSLLARPLKGTILVAGDVSQTTFTGRVAGWYHTVIPCNYCMDGKE